MTSKSTELAIDLPNLTAEFAQWWLPRRPLCCDDYAEQQRRSREDALRYRMIEVNPAAVVDLLVVDIDDENARTMALWGHSSMLPNILTENPANGHAHAVWTLTHPVARTEAARLKPLKLAHAVTEGLRRSCDGDEGYAGHLMKNPLHEAWAGELVTDHTYELAELAAALEAAGDMPPQSWRRTKRARTVGLGRNCTTFDTARVDAYRFIRRLPDRSEASSALLREHVRRVCHEINADFPDPLPHREVEDIARSIHKWITTRSRMWRDGAVVYEATLTAIQSARNRKGQEKRWEKTRATRSQFAQEVYGK